MSEQDLHLHAERAEHITQVVSTCVQDFKLLERGCHPAFELVDLDKLGNAVNELVESMPHPFVHAFAVKANPMRGVLSHVFSLGMGAECASLAEAKHALWMGCSPSKVVLDSVAKTRGELEEAIKLGLAVHIDSEAELREVAEILEDLKLSPEEVPCIGLRLNPLVGAGAVDGTSTATATSKFGLPLDEGSLDHIFQLYKDHPFLSSVHEHVGSQGIEPQVLVQGAKTITQFALDTNARLGRTQITTLDIGGGVSINYHTDSPPLRITFKEYGEMLRSEVPELFSGAFRVFTEFGRSVVTKTGVFVSRVQTVKTLKSGQTAAVVHFGANHLLREVYVPQWVKHRMTVLSPTGSPKSEDLPFGPKVIAGPLCFSGDILSRDVPLPEISVGDLLVVHDTGGYTTSMFSHFNSRPCMGCYAVKREPASQRLVVTVLKEPETIEDALRFWGSAEPTLLQDYNRNSS